MSFFRVHRLLFLAEIDPYFTIPVDLPDVHFTRNFHYMMLWSQINLTSQSASYSNRPFKCVKVWIHTLKTCLFFVEYSSTYCFFFIFFTQAHQYVFIYSSQNNCQSVLKFFLSLLSPFQSAKSCLTVTSLRGFSISCFFLLNVFA